MRALSSMIGQTLGHYRILEQIGAGGMGVVYRAHDERLDRDVALKVLPTGTLSDEAARKRFRKEAQALSKLNHPNIETVHDFDTQNSVDFLVMELIPGMTLDDRLAAGALPEKEVASLGSQLAQGLAAAHAEGVVHRDLKPGNLRITPDGRLKILDFGLARLLAPFAEPARTESLSQTQAAVGTLPYMSPEQLRAEPADARSDIWAAGAVLYEMATGQRPFQEKVATALAGEILHKSPPAPRQFKSDLSPRLEDIILKCLEKDPENRYQSAKELQVDLRRLASSETAVVVSPEAARRPRRLFWAAGLGLVAFLAVLAVWNVGGWRQWGRSGASPARIESLAVLPLQNLSRDPEQEYFVDGMTEALIADLAKIGALRVISRTSVMQYKGVAKPLPQIARELNVDAVVEGSVFRSGNRVRITAQLIYAARDEHLWAESYERELRDVLALQSEVSRAIAQQIKIKLTPQEQLRLATTRPVNLEAHEAYLKGRYHLNKATEKEIRTAITYFQQASEKDPTYAPAYAGLADSYMSLAWFYYLSPRQAMPQARAAALKALELDEGLAEAHVSLGRIRLLYDWDWQAAEAELKRAIELNPSHANAHHSYGYYLMTLGQMEQAIAEVQRAQQLDPLDLVRNADGQWVMLMARQYDQAIGGCRKIIELNPSFALARATLGVTYAQKGEFPEAIAEAEAATRLDDSPLFLAFLADVYARAGKLAEAKKALRDAELIARRRYVCSYEVAVAYVTLGEKDRAFQWLEKAHTDRADCIVLLRVDPRFDSLRPDPRFQELMQRVGIPSESQVTRGASVITGSKNNR